MFTRTFPARLLVVGALLGAVGTVQASNVTGTVTGVFQNPVTTGYVLNPDGTETYYDNTATAGYLPIAPNDVVWGNIPTTVDYGASRLQFIGNTLTNVVPGQGVALGTIKFFNGTSELTTLIFGLELVLDVTGAPDPNVDSLTVSVDIWTTVNSLIDPAWDADFVTLSNLSSSDTSLHAYESREVEAILYGSFIGDPQFDLFGLVLAAGQEDNGFVNNGPVAPPLPLPGTLWLSIVALAGLTMNRSLHLAGWRRAMNVSWAR